MRKQLVLLVALALCQTSPAFAHKTTLDSYGCHNNTALAVYECHTGTLAGRSWPNPGGKTAMLVALNTPVIPPPPTPVVTMTGSATLTWNDPGDKSITGYRVYWGLKDGEWQESILIAPGTTVTFNGLLKGATYYFSITAVNSAGESPKSNVVNKYLTAK